MNTIAQMKSWKCRLGFHDWEIITDNPKLSSDGDGLGPWIEDKLCIRPYCRVVSLIATEITNAREKAKTDAVDRANIANEKHKLHTWNSKEPS